MMQNERLRQIIRDLQRHQFGRRAETLPEDQMLLGLEDVEQTAASDAAGAEQATPAARQAGATNACWTSSSSGRNCLPTRRRCRCWIPAAVAPRSGSCGPMPPTTDHGADPIRRAWPMSTPQTAKPSGRSPISTASRACCRWMAMPATADWPSAATCSSRSAGSMCGVTSTSSRLPVLRRLPAKRFSALLHCMRSRRTNASV